MTGVSRVVAVVAGDPQNPVLNVVQSVGCRFGAAVREDSAAATGRRRLARQVCALQGLQPNTRLVSTLKNSLGAHHCRSEREEMRWDRGRALITMRETSGAASTISSKRKASRPTSTFLQWCSRTQSKVIKLKQPGSRETPGGVSLLSHAFLCVFNKTRDGKLGCDQRWRAESAYSSIYKMK